MSEEKEKVEAARGAFVEDFGRFRDLNLNGSSLADAEAMLRELGELKVRQTWVSGKRAFRRTPR